MLGVILGYRGVWGDLGNIEEVWVYSGFGVHTGGFEGIWG